MTGHVQGVAKDIAAIEASGPNPDHTFRMLRDRAYQQMLEANPVENGKVDYPAARLENLYNPAAGKTGPVANPRVAQLVSCLGTPRVAPCQRPAATPAPPPACPPARPPHSHNPP